MNGLTNAMKFCSNGEIVISLRTTSDRKVCILQIQDHGIGIDPDALPRLMQPFIKMDTDSPGAGLGLYITKAMVEKLGGTLKLESTKGEGSTFTATFPITLLHYRSADVPLVSSELRSARTLPTNITPGPSPHTPDTHIQSLPRLPASSSRFPRLDYVDDPSHPLRILIIDDNAICRKLLSMAFKRTSMSIKTKEAENGKIGVAKFVSFRPDIVFTDVSMPVMDGVTAAGQMREIMEREDRKDCRIYAITGLGSSDPRTQSMGVNGKAALDGWLVKGKDMLDTVYNILQEVGEKRQKDKEASLKAGG